MYAQRSNENCGPVADARSRVGARTEWIPTFTNNDEGVKNCSREICTYITTVFYLNYKD